jgi:hypothetical protein
MLRAQNLHLLSLLYPSFFSGICLRNVPFHDNTSTRVLICLSCFLFHWLPAVYRLPLPCFYSFLTVPYAV